MVATATSAEDSEDMAKVLFCQSALSGDQYFKRDVALDADLQHAVDWQGQRTASDICAFLEARVSQRERAADELRRTGAVSHWLSAADAATQKVSANVNGPLLCMLAESCSYHDPDCINLFRYGAPLVRPMSLRGCARTR